MGQGGDGLIGPHRASSIKGALLPIVLLVSALLLVVGLAYLGTRARLYQSATQSVAAAQARGLALAGLEDARAKLSKDLTFPPAGALGQEIFTYSEDVTDSTGELLGTYTVTVDMTHRAPPYQVVGVTSVGRVGPRGRPVAERVLKAEWDGAPFNRVSGAPNPNLGRWMRFDDLGSR